MRPFEGGGGRGGGCHFVGHFWDCLSPCRLGKCRCRNLAKKKMSLSVQHKFLWYSVLNFTANIAPEKKIVVNLPSWMDCSSIMPTLAKRFKENNRKSLKKRPRDCNLTVKQPKCKRHQMSLSPFKKWIVAGRILSSFSVGLGGFWEDCRKFSRPCRLSRPPLGRPQTIGTGNNVT